MANVYMGKDVEDFIFGEGTVYESAETTPAQTEEPEVEIEQVTDEEMNVFGVIECVEDPAVACYRIALENEQNYNAIMNAFMAKEFSVLESTGEEMVYEAADIKKFFSAVGNAIKKFWAKVKGVFKKLMDIIASNVATNKAFVKKYSNATMHKPETGKEFKGYKFSGLGKADYDGVASLVKGAVKVDMIVSATEEEVNKAVTTFNENFESVKGEMRAVACGRSKDKPVKADEFNKALRDEFFGSDEPVKIEKLPEFKTLIAELGSAINAKSLAKESYKAAEKAVKILQGDVNHAEANLKKVAGKKDHGLKMAKCLTTAINASLAIMSTAMSVQTSAIAAQMKQARSMAAYYITHQPKVAKDPVDESVEELDIVLI